MRTVCMATALSASLVLAAGAPAFAADADAAATAVLTSKVDAAIANATSYRIMVASATGPLLDIRSFGPDRVKIVSTAGGSPTESIVTGTRMYYRSAGSDWKAYPVPPLKHMRKNRLYMGAPDTLLEPLADRTDAWGATVGAFRSAAAGNSQLPGTMECTYDKTTFRPLICAVALQGLPPVQVTYGAWDDPANAVEPPDGVAAPPAPSPAASAKPVKPN
jgi:hypothetical protein